MIKENKTTKQGKLGIFLGCISFLPVWLTAVLIIGSKFIVLGIILALITQALWLTSIELCTWDLVIKNEQLKKKIKKLEGLEDETT